MELIILTTRTSIESKADVILPGALSSSNFKQLILKFHDFAVSSATAAFLEISNGHIFGQIHQVGNSLIFWYMIVYDENLNL